MQTEQYLKWSFCRKSVDFESIAHFTYFKCREVITKQVLFQTVTINASFLSNLRPQTQILRVVDSKSDSVKTFFQNAEFCPSCECFAFQGLYETQQETH